MRMGWCSWRRLPVRTTLPLPGIFEACAPGATTTGRPNFTVVLSFSVLRAEGTTVELGVDWQNLPLLPLGVKQRVLERAGLEMSFDMVVERLRAVARQVAVVVAAQHSGGVLDGLLVPDLGAGRFEVSDLGALIVGGYLEISGLGR